MEDLKIQESDYTGLDVEGMPDSPTTESWAADDIKERLDALVKELMAVRFNALIDALIASTETSGAEEIGSKAISGVTGTDVHTQLSDLKTQIDNAVISGLTEDSITDVYLSGTAGNIKPNYAAHIVNYLLHVGNAGTTSGSGSAYTAALSGFSADSNQFFTIKAHAANSNNATLAVNSGTARQIIGQGSSNIVADNMHANGTYLLMYDAANTRYVLLNPDQTNNHTHYFTSILKSAEEPSTLSTVLSGKANSSHTQEISTIIGLADALAGKAPLSHTQAISTITDLQTELNAKFPASKIIYQSGTPAYVAGAIWLKPV